MLHRRGAVVLWRCHVGVDEPGPQAREAWAFLLDDVRAAELCVFSRSAFAWDVLDPARVAIMAPCIDVLAPKNRPLQRGQRRALLQGAGIVADGASSPTTVGHRACLVEGAPLPADAPFVVQVSRWDPLKDHEGVLQAFVDLCRSVGTDAHLVLAGPETDGVADDPEGDATFARLRERWAAHLWRSLDVDCAKPLLVINPVNMIWRDARVKRNIAAALDISAKQFGLQVAFFCNETRDGDFA